jgi:WD40 repeat protein
LATTKPLRDPLDFGHWRVDVVQFSPDGKLLAAGGGAGLIRLWETKNWQTVGEPMHHRLPAKLEPPNDAVSWMCFSPDGAVLASNDCTGASSVVLWDVRSRKPLPAGPLIQNARQGSAIAFSPDGRLLAHSSAASRVSLWDWRNRRVEGPPLETNIQGVWGLSFSPDGRTLAISGAIERHIELWDVASRRMIGRPLPGHAGNWVFNIVFSPDGRQFASSSSELLLWDAAGRDHLAAPLDSPIDNIYGLAFSPDSKRLLSAGRMGNVALWDVSPDRWELLARQAANRNLTRSEWSYYLGDEPYRPADPAWPVEP